MAAGVLLAWAEQVVAVPAEEWGERRDGGYYRLVDLDGRFITETARELSSGDLYISQTNDRYIVDRIRGDTVYARHDGKEKMPAIGGAGGGVTASLLQWAAQVTQGAGANRRLVGIYHTHSDESYVPTSGTESISPRGDVYEVGAVLADALGRLGYRAQQSWDTYLPHDGQAYVRSRRTVAEFSRERPQTIIDIHRDAIPDPSSYRTTVDGEQMTAIRLVVGRQNQNRDANLAYAKRIKAIADQKYPGLVKGIFHAQGNYNQDLGPRMVLCEFGTHTTSLPEAKKSAALLAEIIPAAAGMAPGTARAAGSQIGRAALTTLWWVLGLAAAGGVAWVFLNKEGVSRLWRDVRAGGALGVEEEEKAEPDSPPRTTGLAGGALGAHRKRRFRRFGRRRR